MTPVQKRMLLVIGTKKIYGDKFIDKPAMAMSWLVEAVELLLLRDIELTAVEDNVDIEDGLIESAQDNGADLMRTIGRSDA